MKFPQRCMIAIPTLILLVWFFIKIWTGRVQEAFDIAEIRNYLTAMPHFHVTRRRRKRNKFEALLRDFPTSYSVPSVLNADDYVLTAAGESRILNGTVMDRFNAGINRYELYAHDSRELMDELMHYMATTPIEYARAKSGGTQVKLTVFLDGDGMTIVKPWRVPRGYETMPDHYYWADVERHNAEIACFHLDRILDFRRAPPTVGRLLNLTEVLDQSDDDLRSHFFRSPANNLCFTTAGCEQHCDNATSPVCGNPDMIEVSVSVYITPDLDVWDNDNPFERSYDPVEKKQWEIDPYYCERVVLEDEQFTTGRLLLDLVDQAILDFLTGNLDRHSYFMYPEFNNRSAIVHLDNGRSFGKYKTDDVSCLATLIQCCIIRRTTYERLLILQRDEYKLGDVMRDSMSSDPIAPVLYEPHYDALNRRLDIIVKEVDTCLGKAASREDVLKEEPILEHEDHQAQHEENETPEREDGESRKAGNLEDRTKQREAERVYLKTPDTNGRRDHREPDHGVHVRREDAGTKHRDPRKQVDKLRFVGERARQERKHGKLEIGRIAEPKRGIYEERNKQEDKKHAYADDVEYEKKTERGEGRHVPRKQVRAATNNENREERNKKGDDGQGHFNGAMEENGGIHKKGVQQEPQPDTPGKRRQHVTGGTGHQKGNNKRGGGEGGATTLMGGTKHGNQKENNRRDGGTRGYTADGKLEKKMKVPIQKGPKKHTVRDHHSDDEGDEEEEQESLEDSEEEEQVEDNEKDERVEEEREEENVDEEVQDKSERNLNDVGKHKNRRRHDEIK